MAPDAPAPTRRALLRSGFLLTVGLAGCVDGPGAGPSTGTHTRTPIDDRTPTRTPQGSPSDGTPTDSDPGPPTGDAVRWTFETGGSVRHRPTLRDGVVYVGGGTNDRATSDRKYVRPKTSENLYALAADDGSERWRYEAAAGVGSPVVRDGVFVVVGWSAGTHGVAQRLVRIAPDGSKRWATEPRDRYLQLLDVARRTAYLGTSDDQFGVEGETLFAVRTRDGTQRWAVAAGDTREAVVSGETLYAVEGGRRTTAVAVGDGTERWHRNMPPATGEPRVFGDAMYLASERKNANGNYPVVAVRAADGRERWRFSVPLDGPFVPTGAASSNDAVYVTEYDGWLFAVDSGDGTERWRYAVDGDTSEPPAVVDETVYLASSSGSVHAVDAATGAHRWKRTVPGPAWIAAGTPRGLVIRGRSGKRTRYLRAYAPDGTERWSFSYAGRLTQPAVAGTRAVVGTESGYVVGLASA